MVRKNRFAEKCVLFIGALSAFLIFQAFQAFSLATHPWEVEVSPAESGGGGLSQKTLLSAAAALNDTGFAVLRGSSIFSEEELIEAQSAAELELERVKEATEHLQLLDRAPWIKGCYRIERLFEFQEALCYSEGRLDMPKLLENKRLKDSRWFGHKCLQGIAQKCLATKCQQSVLGALWNFPGSGPPVWHRDGEEQLLVAVTAAKNYPETVGFIHGQPYSHRHRESPGAAPPDESLGEMDIPLPLRRGETLLFWYTTKHAATPNFSDQDRCLIYSVHGPVGMEDQQNHKSFLPSLFKVSSEEARHLDEFYYRQGYGNTPRPVSTIDLSAPLLAGTVSAVLVLGLLFWR